MKNGFTLIELLLVITLVAIFSVSTMLVYNNVLKSNEETELNKIYSDVQRAAKLYVDLNDNALSNFNENGVVYITLGELESRNYIENNLKNPVNKEVFPYNYYVKVYIDSYHEVDSVFCTNNDIVVGTTNTSCN